MLRADELHHVVDARGTCDALPMPRCRRGRAPIAVEADHAARRRAGPDLVVADVPAVRRQSARGLEWLKIAGAVERSIASIVVRWPECEQSTTMPTRFISSTTARPKRRQSDILVVAAAAGRVVAVVGEQHLAHAEAVVERDHREIVSSASMPSRSKVIASRPSRLARSDVVRRLRPADTRSGRSAIRRRKVGERADRVLPRDDVVADVDGEVVDAGRAPAFQLVQVGCRDSARSRSGRPRPARRGADPPPAWTSFRHARAHGRHSGCAAVRPVAARQL